MNVLKNKDYIEDIEAVCRLDLPWDRVAGRSVLISGAAGMIGSCLVDVLMLKNKTAGLNCKVYAVGRDAGKAKERFLYCYDTPEFEFIAHDINKSFANHPDKVDFILHLASNTHPMQYSTDPIGTITTNIIGTNNLLRYAVENDIERFLFASSVEVYGENRGDIERFDESYLGYIDCNTLRAGYPESKRCGEALCQAYKKKYGLNVVVSRLSRVYGPTMQMTDSRAISQFIKKGIAGEDIVLKSEGNQLFSYCYVADAVAGLLTILIKGENGEAYNIADKNSDITLKELAELVATVAGTKVKFDLPSDVERAGYSNAIKSLMNPDKLQKLGWKAQWDIHNGIIETIGILKSIM